jgi:D-3-phosphoglycerate dehydrogenase
MKILVADSLSEAGVEILRKESGIDVDVKTKLAPEELAKIISQYSGLVVRRQRSRRAQRDQGNKGHH